MAVVCTAAILTMALLPSVRAAGLEPQRPMIETAITHGSETQVRASEASRIALYGDSLVSEAGQDFAILARRAGAAVQVRTFPGTSPCDFFASMKTTARQWHPTVAVLAFTGDAFTACNGEIQVGTAKYFRTYRTEIGTALSIFRSAGARVVLVGQPADASARLTKNGKKLNQLFVTIAKANPGVTYDDAGRAVTANGRFTWTLPCLAGQPCTGPHGTDVVRGPDGVHFCPNGKTTPDDGLEQCDVFSSGALRFASAMLNAVLASRSASGG
jgi:hypothetical protein